jgi:hypothetical protein
MAKNRIEEPSTAMEIENESNSLNSENSEYQFIQNK